MDKRLMVLASAVALATAPAFAQEDESSEPTADDAAAIVGVKAKQPQDKPFHMLPLCRVMEGGAEVLRPGAQQWVALEEGRFYPLGCTYRTTTENARLIIQFGRVSEVHLEGIASFGTRVQQVGLRDRTVVLKGGTIRVVLPRSMQAGLFKVTAPGFAVSDLAGESTYTYAGMGDGDEATIRCMTGTLTVEGRHFRIPSMHAANAVRIRTSQDLLFTALYGVSGDCIAKLDQGLFSVPDPETGSTRVEDRKLDWHLSPKTAVRIHRAKPTVGDRMAVTVMTFDEAGGLVNRCAFSEGRSELNSGELGEKALAEKEESAKRAMESADSVTTEAVPEEESSTESTETTTEESTEE